MRQIITDLLVSTETSASPINTDHYHTEVGGEVEEEERGEHGPIGDLGGREGGSERGRKNDRDGERKGSMHGEGDTCRRILSVNSHVTSPTNLIGRCSHLLAIRSSIHKHQHRILIGGFEPRRVEYPSIQRGLVCSMRIYIHS